MAPPLRLESTLMPQGKRIHWIDTQHFNIRRIACEIEPHDDNEVGKDQDTAFEIITLALAIDVAEEEDAENDSHHVPLWEDEVKGVAEQVFRIDVAAVNGAIQHQDRNLEETDLQSVCRANLHGESYIAVHGEGDGVEKFSGIGNKSKECDSEEFLVDVNAFEDHVDGVHEDLGDDGIENCSAKKNKCTLDATPIRRVMAAAGGAYCGRFMFIV